eukprot:g17627.t1
MPLFMARIALFMADDHEKWQNLPTFTIMPKNNIPKTLQKKTKLDRRSQTRGTGGPVRRTPYSPGLAQSLSILVRLVWNLVLCVVVWLPLSLPLLLCCLLFPPCPLVPTLSEWVKHFRDTLLHVDASQPEGYYTWQMRLDCFGRLLSKLSFLPLSVLMWHLDDVLYSWNKVKVENVLFLITGARAGSTQLVEYLETDSETFVAPSAIEETFPFVWLWKLAPHTLGRVYTKEQANDSAKGLIGKDSDALRRHRLDMFAADTFEVAFLNWDPQTVVSILGRDLYGISFDLRQPPEKLKRFERFLDAMMQKVALTRNAEGKKHMLVKGHFIEAAPSLAVKYPKAVFVTVCRKPKERFRSAVNYLLCLPKQKAPLAYISTYLQRNFFEYTQDELDFFLHRKDVQEASEQESKRLTFSFDDFIGNLPALMQEIYAALGLGSAPDRVKRHICNTDNQHKGLGAKSHASYKVNLTLENCGASAEFLASLSTSPLFREYAKHMTSPRLPKRKAA